VWRPAALVGGVSKWFCSRLHHPIAQSLCEFDGYSLAPIVVLHGNYGCVSGPASSGLAFHSHMILELEGQIAKKNRVFRAAELQNGGFAQLGSAPAESDYLHGYANGRGAWKETRQLPGAIQFRLDYGDFR
jgi:hypothetical protein